MHFAVGQVDSKPHLPDEQVKWKQWQTSFNKVIIYMYTVKCMYSVHVLSDIKITVLLLILKMLNTDLTQHTCMVK